MGPVEGFVDPLASVTQPVDTECSAEGGVVWRGSLSFVGREDSLILARADAPRVECSPSMLRSREVDAKKELKPRARMNAIDVEGAEGRGAVAARPIRGKSTSANGDAVEPLDELATSKDRERLALGVNEDPGVA